MKGEQQFNPKRAMEFGDCTWYLKVEETKRKREFTKGAHDNSETLDTAAAKRHRPKNYFPLRVSD